MKRAGGLFEKVVDFKNLILAAKKAMRGKKANNASARFYFDLEKELLLLQEQLTSRNYIPKGYTTFEIREPKVRKICAANFRDRVVHHAICNVLEPIFERRQVFDSYACRSGKGSHLAVNRLQNFTRKYPYYLKCDIQKYFESIDHKILKNLLRKTIKDQKLLFLLDQIIDYPIPGYASGKSLPIGNLTSQHFANLYLGELDHFVKDFHQIKGYVRYLDDFIVLMPDKKALHLFLGEIRKFLAAKLALQLKEKVVRIAPVTEGVPYLSFRIFPETIRLQRVNLVRWRKKMREKENDFIEGRVSEESLIASQRSMLAHIAWVNSYSLRQKELERYQKLA